MSENGRLIPGPDDDPFGFQLFLANNPNQVTTGNLGTTTTLDGILVTPVGYDFDPAFPIREDLLITWSPDIRVLEVPFIPPWQLPGGGVPVSGDFASLPEPASHGMLMIGLVFFGLTRRRKK